MRVFNQSERDREFRYRVWPLKHRNGSRSVVHESSPQTRDRQATDETKGLENGNQWVEDDKVLPAIFFQTTNRVLSKIDGSWIEISHHSGTVSKVMLGGGRLLKHISPCQMQPFWKSTTLKRGGVRIFCSGWFSITPTRHQLQATVYTIKNFYLAMGFRFVGLYIYMYYVKRWCGHPYRFWSPNRLKDRL